MGSRDPSVLDPAELPEPGPDLEAMLAGIESRLRESMAHGCSPVAPPAVLRDVAVLLACVRELLRDRDALLEEIDALECGGDPARAP